MGVCAVLLSWVFTLSDYHWSIMNVPKWRLSHGWQAKRVCSGRSTKLPGWSPVERVVAYLDDCMNFEYTLYMHYAR
jgi:hypothetical protein